MINELPKEDLANILLRVEPLREKLRSKRLFITGGTGFFGKWLLESFVHVNRKYELGAMLTVLSRFPENLLAEFPYFRECPDLTFIQGDVRSFKLPSGKYDYVIHAATEASAKLDQEDPEEMYSVITEGTRKILELMRHCSATRLLFISSGAIYGSQPPSLSLIPETYDGTPTTAYGKGKKASEQFFLDASTCRFECVIARPFAFVGPYLPLDTHFAVGNFILDCLEKRPIIIKGDGSPLRSYMYSADLAVWLWTILVNGQNGRAYNVGSEQAISISTLAEEISRCFNNRNEIRILQPSDKVVLPPRYVPDISRAMSELNLKINFNLRQSLEKTIRWHSMKNK
jgi:dTDP-glucose 4,6-dehydratase